MTRHDLTEAIDRAVERLEIANSIEPGGTPTDITERAAILALEYLRSEIGTA